MAKKLKVRTPVTTDGVNLAYDAEKQPIYTESIVEVAAKPIFESLNAALPDHLKHELTVFEEKKADTTTAIAAAKDAEIAELKRQLEEDAQIKAIKAKDEEIAALKRQLEEATKPVKEPAKEAAKQPVASKTK